MSVLGVAGAIRRVGAEPAQMGSDGRPYRFRAWSDGGAIEHDIVTPDTDETFVAEFTCVPREPGPLSVVYANNKLELAWQPAPEECLTSSNGNQARYRVYAGSTARPNGAARFPLDPAFRLVGDSATGRFSFVPRDEDQFLIVVGVNEDGHDGQTGHWGF